MPPTQELIDELFLNKVRRARTENPVEKFLDGARLFDMVCRTMRDGIRHRNPGVSAEQIERLLFDQFRLLRRLEEQ